MSTARVIRNLVQNKTDLVVVDKQTSDDITRSILLQVLIDQEQNGDAILGVEFLIEIIRSSRKVVPMIQDETENTLTSGP